MKVDDLLVSTDTDLQISGEYAESWIIVDKEYVLVYFVDEETNEALLLKEIPIKTVETARADTRVGSGFIEVKRNGVFEELLRFSNKNADKFAKVTSIIKSLAEGRQIHTLPEKEERIGRCEKCGVRLPDRNMKICPKCLKRGAVFLRFLKRTKGYWPQMVIAMLLVIASIVISLVPAQLMAVLLDNVFGEAPIKPWFAILVNALGMQDAEQYRDDWLYIVVGFLAAATLLGSIIGSLRETLAMWINNQLGYELRRDVFQKLQELAIRYHDTHPVGSLMTRCTQDIEALQGFINQITSGFGYQIIQLAIVATAMLTVDAKLTFYAVLPAPIVMFCTVKFYHFIVPRWRKYWTTRSNLSNMLHGTLNGIRVVKAFAQEHREAERFSQFSGRFRDAGLEIGYPSAWFYPAMGWVFQLGSYVVWIVGGWAVLHSSGTASAHTAGTLIMFLGYLGMFYAPLNSLTQMSTWFTQFTTQAHRVFEVLDEEPEVTENDQAVDIEIQGAIQFKNVTFGYDPHIPVLQDVSFKVDPGEMVGIVGHSGSGKSTTVNLIMRFYEPTEGEVTIDNVDIRTIKKLCLRRQIGFVAQDPFLFRGTIAENIAYGNPRVAPQQILNAALAANAHMFITRIHDGYDKLLGEHGAGLSGGERQRVAIARALVHNPRILILDEATSSVDTIAEREIQRALEALSLGRTTIAVAHRLSTLRNCDRIIVFEEGRIREQGTHEELMALNGIYKKLVDIQTQLTSDTATTVDNLVATDQLAKAEGTEVLTQVSREEKLERRRRLEIPKIRYLDPKDLRVYSKDVGGMRVEYKDEVYDNVHAYRCFPISRPSEFIALWTGQSALEHKEIGMIRRLKELLPSSRLAVEHELAKRYFIHYVKSIKNISEEMGFLVWQVETDKGEMEFLTRRYDRSSIIEIGTKGYILVDVDNNRYEIEELDLLDAASKAKFMAFYW
ncbi:MAG TPA: DUF1854 domain-containing protein [Candidatus Hydrogenedentes bacterium]|nr:DUF1854 domain-containing protein [Candidatus Hydrogenedentota bacterium]HOL77818.1 DUF1854 domain-containing protein [Candidatus Hydrogenedentota bacterium]HPO86880.1 DUF1854 domain-containing protein [Candidatus Hydrogenedentota bacterium]